MSARAIRLNSLNTQYSSTMYSFLNLLGIRHLLGTKTSALGTKKKQNPGCKEFYQDF